MKMTVKEILKNRIFCVLLAIELLLLLVVAAGFFKTGEVLYPACDGAPFSLEAGTYTVRIAYTASEEVNVFRLADTVNGAETVTLP